MHRAQVPKNVWIVSTSLDQPDKATRKAIRSHVMRDKNTKQAQRSRKLARLMETDNSLWTDRRLSPDALEAQGDVAEWIPKVPRKIATELALADFPVEMTPHMLDLIYRAFTVIKPSSYTIEAALVADPRRSLFCFDSLSKNPGLIHSMLFTAQCLYDSTRNIVYSKAAQVHFAKALAYLQQELQLYSATNATMAIVVSLAMAAIMLHNSDMAMKHMDGLYQLIQSRGGPDSLGQESMVVHKAQRIDFGLSMVTGRQLRFSRPVSWEPHVAVDAATHCPELNILHPQIDQKLLNVWADLREFSKVANEATRTNVKMTPGFFYRLSKTVPYRLLAIEFDLLSNSELLRLCMLIYAKGLLCPINGFGKQLTYLIDRIKFSLLGHQIPDKKGSNELLFWALFITELLIFEDFDKEWIREMAESTILSLNLRTWEEARSVLKRYLWIDIVFDGRGKALFSHWMGRHG